MNREIKFRGKDIDTGEWRYGYVQYNYKKTKDQIISPLKIDKIDFPIQFFDVEPKTVGQFTGLYDKNGKEIYEGDILKWDKYDTSKHFQIEYNHGGFGYWYYGEFYLLGGNTNFSFKPFNKDKDFEIIGNIYDNLDLLSDNKK